MYNITLKKSAVKDLDKINEPFISSIIKDIESLESNPRNEKVKKLVSKEEFRLRVGNYRILFFIDDAIKEIKIARILHRSDAYK